MNPIISAHRRIDFLKMARSGMSFYRGLPTQIRSLHLKPTIRHINLPEDTGSKLANAMEQSKELADLAEHSTMQGDSLASNFSKVESLGLKEREKKTVSKFHDRIAPKNKYEMAIDKISTEAFRKILPENDLKFLSSFLSNDTRLGPNRASVALFKNGPTKIEEAKLFLHALSGLLGKKKMSIWPNPSERADRIHVLTPNRQDSIMLNSVSGTGIKKQPSHSDLSWETAPPEAITLTCIEGDKKANTFLGDALRAFRSLPANLQKAAQEPIFHIQSGASYKTPVCGYFPLARRDKDGALKMRWLSPDTGNNRISSHRDEGMETIRELNDLFKEKNCHSHSWQPGDTILLNNGEIVHGRGGGRISIPKDKSPEGKLKAQPKVRTLLRSYIAESGTRGR